MAETNSVTTLRVRRVRDRILEVAARRLAERGFEGTSLQDICDEVGIRKASLFHHFRSKEQLRQSVIDNLVAHWNTSLPGRPADFGSREDRYAVLTRELVRFLEAEPDRARLIVREALDRPRDAQVLLSTLARSWMAQTTARAEGESDFRALAPAASNEEPDVALMLLLVIGAIGLSSPSGALLPAGERTDRRSRYIDEVIRAGRMSLLEGPASGVVAGVPSASFG